MCVHISPLRVESFGQICYFLFCITTLLFSMRYLKYHSMDFLSNEEQLGRFIGLASSVIGGVAKMYFLYLITFAWSDMVTILPLLAVSGKENYSKVS